MQQQNNPHFTDTGGRGSPRRGASPRGEMSSVASSLSSYSVLARMKGPHSKYTVSINCEVSQDCVQRCCLVFILFETTY